MGTPWALTAHFTFLIVKERKGQLPQWGGVMANRNLPRLRWKTCIWNGFPRRKQPPLTWNPQAHRVTDVRLELVCVEPGLREAAAEAGVQGFTEKRWQPLGGKQSPGKCSGPFPTQKRAPDFRRTCDKTLCLTLCYLPDHMLSMCAKLLQLCLTLCKPMDWSPPSSSVHRILQAKYWSGLPCPPPGDLPKPGIESTSLMSPALESGFFTTSATWEVPSGGLFPSAVATYLGGPLILRGDHTSNIVLCWPANFLSSSSSAHGLWLSPFYHLVQE